MGGEFEIAIDMMEGNQSHADYQSHYPYSCWLDTGRSAVYVALQNILARGGSKIAWVPAYICPSVIGPFRELGFTVHFYAAGPGLQTDMGVLALPAGSTFLFVHYFGQVNSQVRKWLKEHERRDFYVIEDSVPASLNVTVGGLGDYVVTSLRKFLPQPDGALLGSVWPIEAALHAPDEAFVSRKFFAKLLRNYTDNESEYLQLFSEAEATLSNFHPRSISWLSQYLMNRTDIESVRCLRRENYMVLSELLQEEGLSWCLPSWFRELKEGEVPLGHPVIVGNSRDQLRGHLAKHQIYCPIHWNLEHLEDSPQWEPYHAMSRGILTLPIDQRLEYKSLQRMAKVIRDFYQK